MTDIPPQRFIVEETVYVVFVPQLPMSVKLYDSIWTTLTYCNWATQREVDRMTLLWKKNQMPRPDCHLLLAAV